MSVNGVLDTSPSGRLRFRPLTHHPTNLPAAPVASQLSITRPEQLTGDLAQQEWLARYDRQRMARDIYVLLYTMGGADDAQNYATIPGDTLFPGKQREEMAQFAVNVVDALDPDNVITQFVYDRDLSDGWDLADEYRYDDGSSPPVDTERGVVFGVERQILALNEAMVLLAKRVLDSSMAPMDHTATQYNDTEHRSFAYVELENVSPFAVNFANNNWQILIKQGNVTPGKTYVSERRLTLRSGIAPIDAGVNSRFAIGTAGDGHDQDTGVVRPSFVMIDPNNASSFQRIVPRGSLDLDLMLTPFTNANYIVTKPLLPLMSPPPPGVDGEVAASTPTDPAGGEFLELPETDADYDGLNDGDVEVEIQLRRRMNLQRAEPATYDADPAAHVSQTRDNPWVVVDQMKVPLEVLNLLETDIDIAAIGPKLESIRSKERAQPLYGVQVPGTDDLADGGVTSYAGPTYQGNSIGQVNDDSTVGANTLPYTLWHPHFDRDFATIGELFNVPLWGPFGDTYIAGGGDGQQALDDPTNLELIKGLATHRLGSKFDEVGSSPSTTPLLVGDDYNSAATPSAKRDLGCGTAGYRILHPEGSDATITSDDTENRWHRALAVLEVPSRMERRLDEPPFTIDAGQIGGTLGVYRTPGRINLNTLRYPEVLAGLLDDKDVFGLDQTSVAGSKRYLFDQSGEATRDWWTQFILARDGVDPVSGLSLPGVPRSAANVAPTGSRPFRSLTFSQHGDVHTAAHNGSLENTIFRSLATDASGGQVDERRRLFELGTKAEHDGSAVNYTAKHRLLSKVMNNTTTRSNMFVISVEIAFFEAKEVPDGAKTVVRVGGRIPTSPTFKTSYRGFFVVDRSKAMELLTPADLPQIDAATSKFVSSFNQQFNYNSLVVYRRVIPD